MENASKALIIAASVLVTILIIAMGVTILNKVQGASDTTALDTTEINMFNSKFERYADKQLGSQVKSLISFAISNASTNKDDPSKLPTVTFPDCDPAEGSTKANGDVNNETYINKLSAIRSSTISTTTYNVKIGYGKTGLINQIDITKPNP